MALAANSWEANDLLAGLPPGEVASIHQQSRVRRLEAGDRLYTSDAPVATLTFPLGGAVSLILISSTTHTLEVASVGAEGAAGIEALHGDGTTPWDAIVQAPAAGVVVPLPWLQTEIDGLPALRHRLGRYSAALLLVGAQVAMCARFHPAPARVARWLLAIDARGAPDPAPISVDLIALMLGLDALTTQDAVAALGSAVEQDPVLPRLLIRDRRALAHVACGCEADRRAVFARLLSDAN